MKKRTKGLLVAGVLVAAVAVMLAPGCARKQEAPKTATGDSTSVAPVKDDYTCTMHTFIHADKPGTCPICGMELVKRSTISGASSDTTAFSEVRFSPAQRVMANISTVTVEKKSMHPTLTAVGVVDFDERRQAVISARMRGRVDSVGGLVVGQNVRAGQTLFSIYSPELLTAMREYLVAAAALAGGELNQNSIQMLDATRQRLQEQNGLTDARIAALTESKEVTPNVDIVAPISGTVIKKNFVNGVYVNEGTSLLELADLSKVWVYLDVYERELYAVHVGSRVALTADAYPGASWGGEVEFIDNVVQPATRTVRVRVSIANPGARLKPQMFVRGSIATEARTAITAPASAVVTTGQRAVVWVEREENVFEPRVVTTGARVGDDLEILTGLEPGEKVASTGGFLIDSESKLSTP